MFFGLVVVIVDLDVMKSLVLIDFLSVIIVKWCVFSVCLMWLFCVLDDCCLFMIFFFIWLKRWGKIKGFFSKC